MGNAADIRRLRDLARRVKDLSERDENRERIARIRRSNGRVPGRPIVWIDEIPWHEMDIDGELRETCEGARAREIERDLLRTLYRWKHIQADMVVEGAYRVYKSYTDTGNGFSVRESVRSLDDHNHIVSHAYIDQLATPEAVERLRLPVIEAHPEEDARRMAEVRELLGDALPVRLCGHGIYHAPWDEISMLRGVEPIFLDMVERPELLHRTIERFTRIGLSRYEQMEAQGLLEADPASLHCTPPYVDDLPASDYDGGPYRLGDVWFRGMAQLFASVSPDMHEEFDLQYMRRISDRCGLAYYGCCEPLDNKIQRLRAFPNLRKIGVSPWANVRASAERIGGQYVFAHKPNPAHVASGLDEAAVRGEISEVIEACRENGCAYEFVLKDISTVSYRPQSLIDWCRVVGETIDGHYR